MSALSGIAESRARAGFADGLGRLVQRDYRAAWFHRAISAALQRTLLHARGRPGGIARLAISMPPQHGKSRHVSELAIAAMLGVDPDLRAILVGYGADFASRATEKTREILDHEAYQRIFRTRAGAVEDPGANKQMRAKDRAHMFRVMSVENGRPERRDGYYLAQGVGGSITGWGYDIGVWDDPIKNPEQARSAAHRQMLIKAQHTVFDTRGGSDKAVQIAVFTRWGPEDFMAYLLDVWRDEGFDPFVLSIPAIREEDLAAPDDPRAEGEGLWLARYGSDYYKRKKEMLLKRDPTTWWAMWQQSPKGAGMILFPRTFWGSFDPALESEFDEITLSIDGNVKASGKSFAVVGVWGVRRPARAGEFPTYYRLDEYRGHWDFAEFVENVKRACAKWPDSRCRLVENKANGPALVSHLGLGYGFTLVGKSHSKDHAYNLMLPAARQGRIFLPSRDCGRVTSSWRLDYELEMQGAGIDKVDDRPDETAQLVIHYEGGLRKSR